MKRPVSVLVFGILNIVFGSIGVLCTPFSLMVLWMPNPGNDPGIDRMQSIAWYPAFMIVGGVLGIAMSAGLLAAGIAMLNQKPWGRTFTLVYAGYAVAAGIIATLVNFFAVTQPVLNEMSGSAGPEQAAVMGGLIGGLAGGLCGALLYPVFVFIFMNRQIVKDYFDADSWADVQAPQTEPAYRVPADPMAETPGREPWDR